MTMYRNTLANLINPVISIDEYEPKSGTPEEIIVVAFELDDQQPAKDLNKFIQRGFVNVIDSDVSPNPNEHGKYFTFLEFKRSDSFHSALLELVEDITNLTGDQKWMVQIYKSGKLIPLYDKSLANELNKISNSEFVQDLTTLEAILRDSDVESVHLNENQVVLAGTSYRISGNLVAITDNPSDLLLNESYSFGNSQEIRLLSTILGERWTILKYGKYIVAENSGISLVLSDVEQLYR